MVQIPIRIEYNNFMEDDEHLLEIRFLRGNTLLHNVFYNIDGLSEKEIEELKIEAVAKFLSVFPEISLEDIMKGFDGVDSKIQQMYKETFGA